ncbi:MAG: hypothetical protein RI935_569 [Candidatus Parcubacteria bacterium]|jgi:predicted Rossmann fold flavoprotein
MMVLKDLSISVNYDVIVIGGGPSGMMAAIVAASHGAKVLILEKNARLGEKLRITGGGRCNILNKELNTQILLKKYGKGEQFLYSPFSVFGVGETISFFESLGIFINVEANGRAFPISEKAGDVAEALIKALIHKKVDILYNAPVSKVLYHDGVIEGVCSGTSTYKAKEYILATGGISHKETGSTGDGFMFLGQLGHVVVPPSPSIVPIKSDDAWIHASAGSSIDNAKVTFFCDDKKSFSVKGRMLFTHFGISGPVILNSAYKVRELLYGGYVTAVMDMFPTKDYPILEKDMLIIFDSNKNKIFKNILKDIAPVGIHKSIALLLEAKGIDTNKKVHSITKEERSKIIHLLKAAPFSIEGLMGFDKAVVADGGVSLEEIDTRTMRSKLIKNLLITGDLLNINRPSGGYSLQLCWTTGYVAGIHAYN